MDNSYLAHHGVLGMKWGVRRYQNKDGSLTAAGEKRYGKTIQKMEKKAINKTYKDERKNGGHFVLKNYRTSTGKNFDDAEANFKKKVLTDKKYKELSKKAFDAEHKKLMSEKSHQKDYDEYVNSKKYIALDRASMDATKKKDAYVKKMAKSYVDTIKEAKLKDLNISENKEIAKKYISDRFDDVVWDGNLEYNPDNYYESWVDKEKWKEGR